MSERVGEVWECKKTKEVFVILFLDYVDNVGDKKWRCFTIAGGEVNDTGEESVYSEMWFSDSMYSWQMRKLSDAPVQR